MLIKPSSSIAADLSSGCFFWRAEHLARRSDGTVHHAPAVDADALSAQVRALCPDHYLWDIWPVQRDDGTLARVEAGVLWVMLSAPRCGDPEARHDVARMRLLLEGGDGWHDCGPLLPDGFSPGTHEWSGSCRLDAESGRFTVWFTATGRRGRADNPYEQRLFHAAGRLCTDGPLPRVTDWHGLTQSAHNDGTYYADLSAGAGVAGHIKGFRDPYWFRDPADGQGYLLFSGSKVPPHASSSHDHSAYDGVIGIARSGDADGFSEFLLLPPLVDAEGLSNELERPHMILHDGLYYLFWSTQAGVFAPGVAGAASALYGVVGPTPFGPFEPMNGSALVLANPPGAPRQAYAWQVLPTLDMVSFIDYPMLPSVVLPNDAGERERLFCGGAAPVLKLALDGATSRLLSQGES